MIVIEYTKQNHDEVTELIAAALCHNMVVAYPTDTSYGLGVEAANYTALDKLFSIKGRDEKKAVTIIPSSEQDMTDVVKINPLAKKLMVHFWPGALTVVMPLLKKSQSRIKQKEAHRAIERISAKTGYLGFRIPKHPLPLAIARAMDGSITATSANVSGMPDCYSGDEVIAHYKNRKLKPDILIYVKSLPKRKPSTVVKVEGDTWEIIREGSITKKQIEASLNKK